jgi:hypothetical protein
MTSIQWNLRVNAPSMVINSASRTAEWRSECLEKTKTNQCAEQLQVQEDFIGAGCFQKSGQFEKTPAFSLLPLGAGLFDVPESHRLGWLLREKRALGWLT